ncbi:hypothetical protein ACIBL3_30185 [Kribbella sp. NPDC050124]|uniref:hypothetical protein n=1 Tax=Kribbella sp. NPDC050124 TaxID=3364114 RepID=UPI0037B63ED7
MNHKATLLETGRDDDRGHRAPRLQQTISVVERRTPTRPRKPAYGVVWPAV